jgi:hypothetical protein
MLNRPKAGTYTYGAHAPAWSQGCGSDIQPHPWSGRKASYSKRLHLYLTEAVGYIPSLPGESTPQHSSLRIYGFDIQAYLT